ncbi:MAG: DUF262 domain-containing protein [Cytophagales bacterium]|nr:DUF262 domain-containing protein [Cytophagales bacterium]
MKATEVALTSFLSQAKTQFIIPVYQRNYDWTETQCLQLFDDVLDIGKKERETHFIGSIVFIHDGVYTSSDVRQLVIIDGQQRLTTFSLLYLALYKFALSNGMAEKANEINELYISNKYVKDDSSKLKLKQSDTNAKAFKFLLTNNDPSNYDSFSRVIENFRFFKLRITPENFDTVYHGLQRLLFVEISLERGKDDPQRIFESLNSTGLELSQADLIRNYILMGLEPNKQVDVFNEYWDIIEQNAKDTDKEESKVSDFIRDYLTYKTKKIPNKSKVYEEFKIRFKDRNSKFYQETLQEIKDFSFHYSKLLNPTKEANQDLRKQLELIKRLEINISFPFLMPVYKDYSTGIITKEIFEAVLRLIQSFTWRRFIVGLPTNALNKIFMALYNDIDKENYLFSIQKALVKKKGVQKFPDDKEIAIKLEEKDVYNIQPKNRTYFLELLENFNNREYVSIDNEEITIEHIFPQNPDEQWYDKLDEKSLVLLKDKYLNTIANLTLSGNNGSLSNKYFLDKKIMNKDGKEQGYNFSRLWLNQFLKEIDRWDVDMLKERYQKLLDRFLKIWSFPEIEIDSDIDTDQDYTISDAPDPRYKKLDYFIWKEEKIVTDEVSKMYYHVIKSLFEENPSSFYHQDIKDILFANNNPDELRTPFAVSPNYFIESNIDNNSKFRKLRALLTKLEYEEDLLINFSELELDDLEAEERDRNYWLDRSGEVGISIVDNCLSILKGINTAIELNYNQSYIGLTVNNKTRNFALFVPKQNYARTSISIPNPDKWVEKLTELGLKSISINRRNGRLKFRIEKSELPGISSILETLFKESYSYWINS